MHIGYAINIWQCIKHFIEMHIPFFVFFFKDPLLTMIICAPNEKQDKGNLGQKGLSDNMKVAFGPTKDHG